jgi:hypothetical protein
VRRAGLFPAYADWIGVFALDANGEVWFAPHPADWAARERVNEPELRHVARLEAGRWNPEVRRYVPQRDAAAAECPSCKGTGHANVPARYRHKIACECGGTGWVPAGWRSEHTSARRWAQHGTEPPPV